MNAGSRSSMTFSRLEALESKYFTKETSQAALGGRRKGSNRVDNQVKRNRADEHQNVRNDRKSSVVNGEVTCEVTCLPPLHGRQSDRIMPLKRFGRKNTSKQDMRSGNGLVGKAASGAALTASDKLRLRRLFRGLILVLLSWNRLWKYHMGRVNEIFKTISGLEALMSVTEDSAKKDEIFDASNFKANKQAPISSEARRILQKIPENRTSQEIHYLVVMLGNYETMSSYPVSMQEMIASRGIYEVYDAKRVIVREGCTPLYFYYILHGAAVVTTYDHKTQKSKTVTFLQRGNSFGEAELNSSGPREATLISKGLLELLLLSASDYSEIFMSGSLSKAQSSFLESQPFMEGWPVQVLSMCPNKARFSYFKKGSVLVHDSNDSEWIYFVKTGSCSVLKKLKETELGSIDKRLIYGSKRRPRAIAARVQPVLIAGGNHSNIINRGLEELTHRQHSDKTKLQELRYYHPDIQVPLNGILHDLVQTYQNYSRKRLLHPRRSESLIDSPDNGSYESDMSDMLREQQARTFSTEPSFLPPIESRRPFNVDNTQEDLVDLASHTSSPFTAEGVDQYLVAERLLPINVTNSPRSSSVTTKILRSSSDATKMHQQEAPASCECSNQQKTISEQKRSVTISDDVIMATHQHGASTALNKRKQTVMTVKSLELENRDIKSTSKRYIHKMLGWHTPSQEESFPDIFVVVQLLTSGSHFGLIQCAADSVLHPGLSLVSNGAECFMIHKKLYLEQAPVKLLAKLREELFPYPSEGILQQGLDLCLHWEYHKKKTVREKLDTLHLQREVQKGKL